MCMRVSNFYSERASVFFTHTNIAHTFFRALLKALEGPGEFNKGVKCHSFLHIAKLVEENIKLSPNCYY